MPLIIFINVLVASSQSYSLGQKVKYLQRQCNILANQIAITGYMNNQKTDVMEYEIEQLSNEIEGRLMVVDSNHKVIKDSNLIEQNKVIVTEEVIKGLKGENYYKNLQDKKYIEIVVPISDPTTKQILGALVVTSSTAEILESSSTLYNKAIILLIILTILILSFSFYYSAILTRPFSKLIVSINRITDGYLDEKISIKGHGEIEEIATAFNQMTTRLQIIEQSRQEFVSNVSHELKTPLTSVKVLADSLLSQEDVPAELYKEFLLDITNEIEREDKIINDLLSLVKLDKKEAGLNIDPININELLEQILKRLRPIAAKRSIELIYESFREVIAEVDEVKLTLAFTNLIANGIKYNRDGGWVKVSLNADHKFMYLKVSDSGIGIPEEEQEHIFERFYRVDKARSRETGGTGLGLSIARNAILMHKGAVKVYSKEEEGTTFTIRIPLYYIS